jgi:hypothetical protein
MKHRLKHWWLWKRRNTFFDSRLAWIDRGMEAARKLDGHQVVNTDECEDALSWDKYCTGGNVKWMLERWNNYRDLGLLPLGDWISEIQPYVPSISDNHLTLIGSIHNIANILEHQ